MSSRSNKTKEAPIHPRRRLYRLFEQISDNYDQLSNVEIRYEGLEDDECTKLGLALSNNEFVEILDLTSNEISESGSSQIIRGLQHDTSHLSSLNLSSNSIGLEGATAIGNLLRINTALRTLNLHECNIGNDGLVALSIGLGSNTAIDKIVLSKNQLNDEVALAALGRALQTSQVSILDLSLNKFGSQGVQSLDLHRNSSIRTILLWGNEISISGGLFMADALSSPYSQICNLNLRNNRIGDFGAESIAFGLEHNTSLRKIWLSSNLIGDEGAIHLARAIRGHSLQSIYLSNCSVGDDGAKAFAELLCDPATQLQVLDLYRNHIGDLGGNALSKAMRQNVSIQDLNIASNRIHNLMALRQVRFLCKCNLAGRYLLRKVDLPTGLWPRVLAKVNFKADVRFFLLREKPDLFIRHT